MRKKFWILASFLALSVLAAVTAAALCAAPEPEAASAPEAEPGGYVLTDAGGEIGVYRNGELILRTGVPLESLRDVDRKLVEAGIQSDSYEDILILLEDLGA